MTPIEAVARRLALLYDEPDWKKCEIPARAALVALRDCGVTEGMREAFERSEFDGGNADYIFRAMLDAAIEGK